MENYRWSREFSWVEVCRPPSPDPPSCSCWGAPPLTLHKISVVQILTRNPQATHPQPTGYPPASNDNPTAKTNRPQPNTYTRGSDFSLRAYLAKTKTTQNKQKTQSRAWRQTRNKLKNNSNITTNWIWPKLEISSLGQIPFWVIFELCLSGDPQTRNNFELY